MHHSKQKKRLSTYGVSLLVFILLINFTVLSLGVRASTQQPQAFKLSNAEKEVLASFSGRTIKLGLDPIAGMEYFKDGDSTKGYIIPLVEYFRQALYLDIKIVDDKSWAEVYDGLHNGDIDLLVGANPTPDRLKSMVFTKSIYSVPYTVLAKKESTIQTIGDLDAKKVGFIHQDIGLQLFKDTYNKISYDTYLYPDQYAALEALDNKEIDGFVTSGGDIVYDYIYDYPGIKEVARIESIRSEMTLSALKENEKLITILQRVIDEHSDAINQMITEARQDYLRKIIQLTPEEKDWLRTNPKIKVGVATDYLPIDYYAQNRYQGISGHYFMQFSDLIGIEIEPVPGSFDEVYGKALKGEIDVLNMAKTNERMANFIFTEAYSDERDLIYGLRPLPYINDIYGLEGKKVAVIEGFWHENYLLRNLRKVEIVKVKDIQEALNALVTRKADYFIETPAVAEFYTVGLGYTNIIKKGETSADSFLYFGAKKTLTPLISIFNKMRPLISYNDSKYKGLQSVPALENIANRRLFALLVGTLLTIVLMTVAIIRIVKKLSRQSSEMLLLKERERLLYLDPLTELYNRNYFNHIEPKMDIEPFPQYLIMADLNDLKIVNDQFGHLAGDHLIKHFSSILQNLDHDAVAIRMGGDEFVLWLKGQQEADVQSLIQRLRFKCQQAVIYDDVQSERAIVKGILVSVGYSMRYDVTKSVEQCLKEADLSMYQDKMHLKANIKR